MQISYKNFSKLIGCISKNNKLPIFYINDKCSIEEEITMSDLLDKASVKKSYISYYLKLKNIDEPCIGKQDILYGIESLIINSCFKKDLSFYNKNSSFKMKVYLKRRAEEVYKKYIKTNKIKKCIVVEYDV